MLKPVVISLLRSVGARRKSVKVTYVFNDVQKIMDFQHKKKHKIEQHGKKHIKRLEPPDQGLYVC